MNKIRHLLNIFLLCSSSWPVMAVEGPFVLDPQYTGRNHYLLTWEYTEPSDRLPFSGTLDEFVQTRRYLSGHDWWLVAGTVADIHAGNSRSNVGRLFGSDAFREIYWANDGFGGADLSDLRIGLSMSGSVTNPQERLLEMFVRNPSTGAAEPFAYYNENGRWVPVATIDGKEVPQYCAGCHSDGQGRLSPFPIRAIRDASAIRTTGYYPEYWEQLLDQENLWLD